jgi:hypothetical protein
MTELSDASLQQMILEERAALATPTDFADLQRRGVFERAQLGWFVLLQPKALPAHVPAAQARESPSKQRLRARRLGFPSQASLAMSPIRGLLVADACRAATHDRAPTRRPSSR